MRGKAFVRLCVWALILFILLPTAADAIAPGIGEKKLSGGQRDFLWPVPGNYGLSGCFLDNRSHYAIDIPADRGTAVTASRSGTVIATHSGCSHNYSKTWTCCSDGYGNYVVLEHDYVLRSGEHITLYTRYSHLTKVSVYVGQTVAAGTKLGTVGSTGYSQGDHLDFQILYGGWKSARSYSLDPYINELLELPDALYCASTPKCCGVGPSACCCYEYIKYIRKLYPQCTHPAFDANGICKDCGWDYSWEKTASTDAMGIYTPREALCPTLGVPYASAAREESVTISPGTRITVTESVRNALGETWYVFSYGNGKKGFAKKDSLTFIEPMPSEFSCKVTAPAEGQTLPQQSYSLRGTVTSRYPLREITAYLDGKAYATWKSSDSVTSLSLRGTAIDNKLSFSALSPGTHTLVLKAKDSTGRDASVILTRTFLVKKTRMDTFRVTFNPGSGSCDTASVTVVEGSCVLDFPTPQWEGYRFEGWYTEAENGDAVTVDTPITGNMTLYAQWTQKEYTVTLGEQTITVLHGQTPGELPSPTREGYTFFGWYSHPVEGVLITEQTAVTEDLTLYPRWEPQSFTVTLDPGEGTVRPGKKVVTFGESYGALPIPASAGSRFAGWLLDGEPVSSDTPVSIAKNHTLTARWEPVSPEPDAPTVPADPENHPSDPGSGKLWILWLLLPLALAAAGGGVWLILRKKASPETPAATPEAEDPTRETQESVPAE